MSYISINEERCKQIKGFEKYHISESGRIYRTELGKKRTWRTEGRVYINEKKVNFKVKDGKLYEGRASLTDKKGKLHNVAVPELVAVAFDVISKKIDKKRKAIGYKDGNIKNLHYSNLMVVNRQLVNSKLTLEDAKHIRKLLKKGIPLNKIADLYCVSDMAIHRVKTGETWNYGKIKIKKPKAPFDIEDGQMRRYIATFEATPIKENIRKPFTVKRNPEDPIDNTIIGIVKGYKLSLKHKNITRAKEMVQKLNTYFFSN